MSIKHAIQASALTVAFAVASGCTTTEYVTPSCTVPPVPSLPVIDRGALWDAVGDAEYRRIERYIDGLWQAVDERGAVLSAVCGAGDKGR